MPRARRGLFTPSLCGAVLGLVVAGIGCGPQPADGGEALSTSSTGEVGPGESGSSEGSTSAALDSSAGDTTAMPPADDTTTEDEYTCGCEARIPVTLDQVIDDGFSASDILGQVEHRQTPFEWVGLETPPSETVLRLALAYEGEQILHGPDGDDGCNFLSAPCHSTLMIPVAATVTTDDGILVATIPSKVEVDLDRDIMALLLDGELPLDQTQGTLAERVDPAVTELYLSLEWHLDGAWESAYIRGGTESGYPLLGRELE